MLNKFLLIFFSLILFLSSSQAQEFDVDFRNFTYSSSLHSVKMHLEGLPLSYPLLPMNSSSRLHLSFDDLEGDVRDYSYTIVHCNADWTRSDLQELEYIDGFTGELIEDYSFSFNTRTTYTHYDLFLPNDDLTWTKSGNYILIIFDEDNENEVVLTRRFMVFDELVKLNAKTSPVGASGKSRTHQEIDFRVQHQALNVRSPQTEIRATVLQNGQWDNAIEELEPLFVRKDELVFDYQGKILFPAQNEFRQLDMRNLQQRAGNIENIEVYNDEFEVTLLTDRKRWDVPYLFFNDINGQFIIGQDNEPNPSTRSDYAKVFFSLYSPTELDEDIYLYGEISDWAIREDMKMVYNETIFSYVAKIPLKEGFYNYAYAAVNPKTKKVDFEETEGNWYQTVNDYTVLVYYRPFSGRYDQLIGTHTITTLGR